MKFLACLVYIFLVIAIVVSTIALLGCGFEIASDVCEDIRYEIERRKK